MERNFQANGMKIPKKWKSNSNKWNKKKTKKNMWQFEAVFPLNVIV